MAMKKIVFVKQLIRLLFVLIFSLIPFCGHTQVSNKTTVWSGTGFALNNGYLVTNWHVVEGAQTVHIYGIRGDFTKKYIADVVAKDKINDLAILKISGNGFPGFGTVPYKIRTSTAEVAEEIFALGFPMTDIMGDELKYTDGRISSLSGFDGDVSTYQISAPVQPGNSGGPLLDDNGNVIGIVCAKIDNRIAQNVNYAVKALYLKSLVETMQVANILPANSQMANYARRQDKVKAIRNFVFYIQCYDIKMPLDDVANRPSFINVSPTSLSFSEKQENKTLEISTNAPSWKIASKPVWCTATNKTTTSVTINVLRNDLYERRSGTIVLETNDGKTVSVFVSQSEKKPPYITANPIEIYVNNEEVSKVVNISTNCESWNVHYCPQWCTIIKKTSAYVSVKMAKNNSYDNRYGTIEFKTINGKMVSVLVSQAGKNKEFNGHEYVDLGLPSGTMWATCNVGATKPEDYGDYFAWGEINTKKTYDIYNYKYYDEGSGFTKYIHRTDTLDTADDAATANWGTGWRMPSYGEIGELEEKCEWTWTVMNGINGYSIKGLNGNAIFLPAAGFIYENGKRDVNEKGEYLSNNSYWPGAHRLCIFPNGHSTQINEDLRWFGRSVRPVHFESDEERLSEIVYVSDESVQKEITLSANSKFGDIVHIPDWCTITDRQNTTIKVNISKNDSFCGRNGTINFATNDGKIYTVVVYQQGKKGMLNGHEYVDLGLPSGTLWATCNVGSTTPEGYGDYFAWGETTTKTTYNWRTYRYCNGNGEKLTKYCKKAYRGNNGFSDNLTTLEAADDAATVNWGEGWRMPTVEEFNELKETCTWNWKSTGYEVKGPNGSSIFLPAAGGRRENNNIKLDWSCCNANDGFYWTKELEDIYVYAFYFDCGYYNYNKPTRGREEGLSVRPVCNVKK